MNSKHSPCPECGGTTPFARNHYFNGKMLVEQDFNEEQRYHAGKLQYHQKNLHGHGVACGLKVVPHPNPACRDRVVEIEPGAAFDCCGRTIAVRDKVCFSFVDAPAVAALPKDDKGEHVLQICIRYTECATDLVPVLFDETSDGSRCEPNRVIESFEFDVMVDPPAPRGDATAPKFAWKNTLKAANARAVVLHENSHRLYILTAGNPGTVFPVNTDNRDFLTPLTLGGKGEALAITKDGKALVVAVTETTGLKLRGFDTADLTKAPVELALPTGAIAVELAVAPDGRLFGLVQAPAAVMTVQTWGSTLLTGSPVAATKVADAPATATQPVFSTDGTVLYLVDKGPKAVLSFDLKIPTPPATAVTLPAGATAGLITLASDTGGDTLVVSDTSGTTVRFRAPDGTWSSATVPLAPTALAPSRGGAWLYVLATDGTDFFVRALSIHRARNNQPQPPNAVVKVGKGSGQPVFSASGNTLFVPFLGATTVPAGLDGGVAVIDVTEMDCGELFWKSLDGCPSCDEPDCLVLATVEHYHAGDKIEDPTDPPTAVSLDKTNHVARIDNRAGRLLLPSTQVLTDVIRCLLEDGHGDGKQGPPGLKGVDGVSVKSASAESIASGLPPQATFNPITGDVHFKIPKGDAGSVPTTKLVSICGINWHHAPEKVADQVVASRLNTQGLLIAFNGKVLAGDINQHSFIVLTRVFEDTPSGQALTWKELQAKPIGGVQLKTAATESCPRLVVDTLAGPNDMVNGAQFRPIQGLVGGQEYRVILKGDLIRADAGDGTLRSLDGNHLFPWVPTRPSGDGIEGGTFESWFITRSQ